jgi:uncharacterized protein
MNASPIVHNAAHRRFEQTVNGHLCVADYVLSDGVMRMTHTEVHPSLQGQGIAAALVQAALAHARAHRFKVRPDCSYVHAYMQRHPQTQDLLV